jgi:hypothetical protein
MIEDSDNKNNTDSNNENMYKNVKTSDLCNFGNGLNTIASPFTGLIAGIEYTPHKAQGLQTPSEMWIDKNNLYDNIGYSNPNENKETNKTRDCNKLNGLFTIGRGLETLESPVTGIVTGFDDIHAQGLHSASDMRLDSDGVTNMAEQNPYVNQEHPEHSETKSNDIKDRDISQFDSLGSQENITSNTIGRVQHKSSGLQSPSEMWIDKSKLLSDGIKHNKITEKYLENLD